MSQAARWTAKDIAAQVLQALREDNHGVLPIPIDPIVVARKLGINVYAKDLGPQLSGMIVKSRADDPPDIFLNEEHAPVRQRFTCAHELGHHFGNYTWSGERNNTYVHQRGALAACGTHIEEKYANAFAANLLMPEEEVRRFHAKGLDEVELARQFWVSTDAMTNRLQNLGLH
jgi:Zn-dependent peptidase ImmA (M78 family)